MSKAKPKVYPQSTPAIPAQLSLGVATEDGNIPFSGIARSMGPVDLFWTQLYHDFAGMQTPELVAIDYCHGDDEPDTLGFANKFSVVPEGLRIDGELIPLAEGDKTDNIIQKARRGVPYQMSIDYRGAMAIEEVSAGATAQVNGQTVSGPCEIVRQWTLTRVAICLTGRDRNTKAVLSEGDEQSVITYLPKEDTPAMNLDQLKADHPDLVNQLTESVRKDTAATVLSECSEKHTKQLAEANAKSFQEGVATERKRSADIATLCETAKLPTRLPKLLSEGLTVDQSRDQLFKELAAANKPPAPSKDEQKPDTSFEEQCKAEYEGSKQLMESLGVDFATYLSGAKARVAS